MGFGQLPIQVAGGALPDDLTDQFNTPLSPRQMTAYEAWRAKLPEQLQNTRDYDLQGAFLAQVDAAANGHLTDRFKKPNHPTFSTGSKYNSKASQGGVWTQLPGGAWAFVATPDNFRHQTPDMLAAYMAQAEPDAALVMPQGGALGPTTRDRARK